MKKKLLALTLSIMMIGTLLTGCGDSKDDKADKVTQAPTATEAAISDEDAAEADSADADADSNVTDISSSLAGVWVDNAGEVFGFAEDSTFYVGSTTSEDEETGSYSLATDGTNTVLALSLDSTGEIKSYYVNIADEALVLTDVDTGDQIGLAPYIEE